MTKRHFPWVLAVLAIAIFLALPGVVLRPGSDGDRHDHRLDRRRAARRDRDRHQRGFGQHVRRGDRRRGRVPSAAPHRHVSRSPPNCPALPPSRARGLQMQVGQQATVNLQMAPSNLQETVTVTGEAPLIDLTTSTAAANIDQRQMQELPLNGRNWLDLTLLAPGSRANAGWRVTDPALAGGVPDQHGRTAGHQQRGGHRLRAAALQPRLDRRVRVHLQSLRRHAGPLDGRRGQRRHASRARNRPAGTFSGYFRDVASWAAKDHVANRTLPFSNQQFSGDLRRSDQARSHSLLCATTSTSASRRRRSTASPLPRIQHRSAAASASSTPAASRRTSSSRRRRTCRRGSTATTSSSRCAARGGATTHPSGASAVVAHVDAVLGSVHAGLRRTTRSTSSRAATTCTTGTSQGLASYKGGACPNFPGGYPVLSNHTLPKGGDQRWRQRVARRVDRAYQVRGYTIGTATNLPQMHRSEDDPGCATTSRRRSTRRDATTCGLGGEFLEHNFHFHWCSFCNGSLTPRSGPRPPTDGRAGTRCSRTVRLVDVELQRAQPAARSATVSRWATSTCSTTGTRSPRGSRTTGR